MHMWQLCHLAMVVPIADAYYEADCPEKAGKEDREKNSKKTEKKFLLFKEKVWQTVTMQNEYFSFFAIANFNYCVIHYI